LALAAKVLSRMERAGRSAPTASTVPAPEPSSEAELGTLLLAIVEAARRRGLDAEGALRAAILALAEAVRVAEAG
jgi:XTP/dITP diphosphohydrolase